MSRFIVLYTKGDDRFAQGPFPSRVSAARVGSQLKSRDFDLDVAVIPMVDRPVELGHMPLGLNASGQGPVLDAEAVSFICLECGCPAVAHPTPKNGNPLDRIAEDLRLAQAELPLIRERLRD